MSGLYERDYAILTNEEIQEKERIDLEGGHVFGHGIGRRNFFHKYPKAIRHNLSLFPNNYMDVNLLKDEGSLNNQCELFERLINNKECKELDVKRFIQNNRFYHIPASIFNLYNFGHHEAALFKEFQLGNNYRADYLLAGRASGGWEFVYVEFESPYGDVVLNDGNLGQVIRKGLNQIDDWKSFLELNYSTVCSEFEKNTNKPLPREFVKYDSTRMHYVVVAGRRDDFSSDNIRTQQRRIEQQRHIKIIHYDNLLDEARRLIGASTY